MLTKMCLDGALLGVNKPYLKEMKCNNNIIHEANLVKRANPHFLLKGSVRETDIATMLRHSNYACVLCLLKKCPMLSCFINFIFNSFVISYWMYFAVIERKKTLKKKDFSNASINQETRKNLVYTSSLRLQSQQTWQNQSGI